MIINKLLNNAKVTLIGSKRGYILSDSFQQ